MSARNKFLILLSVIFAIALAYYFFSTPSAKDLVLIGTVDANQVVVSPQIQGRIAKLLVDEGTPVKQGDLIAILDPSELEARSARPPPLSTAISTKSARCRPPSRPPRDPPRATSPTPRPSCSPCARN